MRSASPNWGSRFKNRPKWEESCLCQKAPWWGSCLAGSCHFRANKLCSFPQISCHKSWAHVWSFGELADITLPTAYENSSATSARSGQQVRDSVSNHVALVQQYAQVCSRLFEHADFRLSAPAALAKLRDFRFWMVEAVIHTIDARAFRTNS